MEEILQSLKTETRIIFCGLDSAGKTAILKYIELGEEVKTKVTLGRRMQVLPEKKLKIIAQDLGGQEIYRKDWNKYLPFSDIVVYVIDASDRKRIEESKREYEKFLDKSKKILFLANKQDLDEALGKKEIIDYFELQNLEIPWHIEETSAFTGEGIRKALNWIYEQQTSERVSETTRLKVPMEHIENGKFACLYKFMEECEKNYTECQTCSKATCQNCMNYNPATCFDFLINDS
ncbi:MAG: ADP-ribosylation factor family protein [Candidatus Hodarchaeota archaeon]